MVNYNFIFLEDVIANEKLKLDSYKEYLQKLKNKESFIKKGAQTINRFKSNGLVSTAFNQDEETEMIDEKINCINYVITDSIAEKKSKIEDFTLMT